MMGEALHTLNQLNQILSTSIRILCLSSVTFCSQSVWHSVGISSISSHPMRDWSAPSAGLPSVSLIL